MSSTNSQISNQSVFSTPPSNKFSSPKSITRKSNFLNFNKKKSTDLPVCKELDRVKFISPCKTTFLVNEETLNAQQSFNFSVMNSSQHESINYQYIKRCVSPNLKDSLDKSKQSNLNRSVKNEKQSFDNILSSSIYDCSNFEISDKIHSTEKSQFEILELKKLNFELNLLVDEKNQFIEKQKGDFDSKLRALQQDIAEIKMNLKQTVSKLAENQQKLILSEKIRKQHQKKSEDNLHRYEQISKQLKLSKGKLNNSINLKSKKSHKNCKNVESGYKGCSRNCHENNSTKANTLIDIKNTIASHQKIEPQLKKIKSEHCLPVYKSCSEFENSPQISSLMKIHSNQEELNEFFRLKLQIEGLQNELRYRDIEILTLKKMREQSQKLKLNYEKVKKFNKRLLARVEQLTDQQGDFMQNKDFKLLTPIKRKHSITTNDDQLDQLFELSPQKNYHQSEIAYDKIIEQIIS